MSALSELVLCLHFLPSTTQEKYRPGTSNLTVLRPCVFAPMHLPAALGVDFSGCQTSSLQSAESSQIPLIYKSLGEWGGIKNPLPAAAAASSLSNPRQRVPFFSPPNTRGSQPISADGHYSSRSHPGNDPLQSPERGRCLRRTCALSLKVTLPPFC